MSKGSTPVLSEAELHGLVDGQLSGGHRGDLLRRAAASPADRDRIACWQDQNDLIRATFRSVEREEVPPTLDLRAPVKLQGASVVDIARGEFIRSGHGSNRRIAGTLLTVLIVAGGLSGAWTLAHSSKHDVEAAEDGLSRRAAAALGGDPTVSVASAALPTTSIPDLGGAGFWLTRADVLARTPAKLVFRYRNAAAELVAIGVASVGPQSVGGIVDRDALVWRRGTKAFVAVGTLPAERLRAVVTFLRDRGLDR